jgi:3alpha(or 20beta)-hydroxysteroid dehydrogenase
MRERAHHPGGVNTAMSNPSGAPLDEVDKHYMHVPLQRVGLPDEIARATLFLTSDEASYCNGAELAVDSGMAAGAYYPGLPGAPL